MQFVDNFIIGAGPGGYELAAELANKGQSVVIAERNYLGGTCLNRGCIPTKTLCASANAVLQANMATNLGVNIQEVTVDYNKISQRVKDVVDGLRDGVASLLGKCTVLNAEASFSSPNTLKVGDEEYEAKRIIIATGSSPARLPIPGSELAMTSDEALWLTELPESMVIIGGGVIGMEFASIFSVLGTKVTVIEYCREILPTVDAEVAKRLRSTLSRRGIDIIVGAAVEEITRADGCMNVKYNGKKGEAVVSAEKVLMSVGRRPVIPNGFVEYGGKLSPKGFVEVDSMMRTSIPGVYAIGDVNGLLMLAHAAYSQGRVVEHSNPDLFNPQLVPSVVFTSPEIACVGPSADALEKEGTPFHVVKHLFASNGKACADGHPEGFVKMLVRDDDNTVASVSIIGHHAADLIAEATILVTERVNVNDIASRYVHAHPTLSEIFI